MLQDKEYVKKLGLVCPHCLSKEIEAAGAMQEQPECLFQDIRCHDCGEEWQDRYELVGYTPSLHSSLR
tara:strand:+ start:6193 stop:6396 length:204 start_codon:yes stop_codon:yes gene_type:complete